MLFLSLITLIMCKALLNDKLVIEFYHRISAIILFFSALLTINSILDIGSLSGIGIYGGLFNISTISQILESFLLIIASLILVSWPRQLERLKVVYRIVDARNRELINSNLEAYLSYPGKEESKFTQLYLSSINLNIKTLNDWVRPHYPLTTLFYTCVPSTRSDVNVLSNSINYSIIVLFSSLGASLLMSCSDLISMYLSIELQSFSLYVLSSLYRE